MPQTQGQVEIRQTQLVIDGQLTPSQSGKTFSSINPATEEVITQIAEGDAADIDRAVGAARQAFEGDSWRKLSARQRGSLMYKLADLIDANLEELAYLEALDSGKPYQNALKGDIPECSETLRYFAGWADKIHGQTIPISGSYHTYTVREPVGVCALIVPWNYPLSLACWKIGAMLATGCTGVLKPSELTSLSALRLGELAIEAGLPNGVLNVVSGLGESTGAALVAHPDIDKIAFTGDYRTAQVIRDATSNTMKRLTCELGGKSPNIIFADADLDAAVKGSIGAIFSNNGQNCCAGSRIFVQDGIYEEFLARFTKAAQTIVIGDPFDEASSEGALVDEKQFNKVLHYIQLGKEEGARLVTGGERIGSKGYFVQPTIFADVTDSMAIAREEIFGPVASVLRFSDLEEVIQRANHTMYGLAAAVWTQDMRTAQQVSSRVRAGTVWVNCYNIVDIAAPFGGYKMSGLGRDLGERALDGYTEHKVVTTKLL